jgi:hypothetical protein
MKRRRAGFILMDQLQMQLLPWAKQVEEICFED